jgi:hypothetical protein
MAKSLEPASPSFHIFVSFAIPCVNTREKRASFLCPLPTTLLLLYSYSTTTLLLLYYYSTTTHYYSLLLTTTHYYSLLLTTTTPLPTAPPPHHHQSPKYPKTSEPLVLKNTRGLLIKITRRVTKELNLRRSGRKGPSILTVLRYVCKSYIRGLSSQKFELVFQLRLGSLLWPPQCRCNVMILDGDKSTAYSYSL